MAKRNLDQEIARILDTTDTGDGPSAYKVIAENLQKVVTHYLVLNPGEIYAVIEKTIGNVKGASSHKDFTSTVGQEVMDFCTGKTTRKFIDVMNSSPWGGQLVEPSQQSIPPEVKQAAGRGDVFMIPPTKNFSLRGFGDALTKAKNQCLIDVIPSALRANMGSSHALFGKDSGLKEAQEAASLDLAKLHGVGDTHTTARVGTAVAGKKSTSAGTLDGPEDMEFGLPLFRKSLFDDLKLSGAIISDGNTSHSGVNEEIQIVLELASQSGKNLDQAEWDAGGPELIAALNRARDAVLQRMVKVYGRGSKEWEASASPQKRLKRMGAEVVTKQLTKGIKPPTKVKKKITEPKVKKGRKSTRAKGSRNAPRKKLKKQTVRAKKGGKSSSGIQRKRASPWRNKAGINPVGLRQLIQKSLPDVIARRMTGPPTLQYRTGRFAESAEITDIVPMPRSVEIRYDYMQNPYRVFEPDSGHPLGTAGRDPRGLIGASIREIAQSIMGDRFGIVRTKRV